MQHLSALWRRALCHGKHSAEVDEQQEDEEESYMIEGPEVDVYSAGVMLYEMV